MNQIADLGRFVSTRDGLHQIAEHVVAKVRYEADGKVGLTAFGGGFATPMLSGGRRVLVVADRLIVDDVSTQLTSVAAAARVAGVEPGFPTDLYPPKTAFEPTRSLDIDAASASALGEWFDFTASVLRDFATEVPEASPSELILWPEHFDQAFFTEEAEQSHVANYGASPGDAGHPEPYLYVGPWGAVTVDGFWNATHFNGAVLSHSTLVDSTDPREAALQFLRDGRSLLLGIA
jgi:hypothetical protein